jgi:hypothetical protein
MRGRQHWLALLRLVSDAAVLAISALEDSREGKILAKRRPVQAKRRDLDAAKINLFRTLQTRVAFRWKAHLMATRGPDEDQAAVMPCLQGTVLIESFPHACESTRLTRNLPSRSAGWAYDARR